MALQGERHAQKPGAQKKSDGSWRGGRHV